MTKRPRANGEATGQSSDVPRTEKRQKVGNEAVKDKDEIVPDPILPFPTPKGLPPIQKNIFYLPLLTQAFTHESYTSDAKDPGVSYDRLEVLGDSYLNIIALQTLYDRFPHANSGELARFKERLVCNKTIAGYSRTYEFPKRTRISGTFLASIADQSKINKIRADIFEAFCAVVVISPKYNDPGSKDWQRVGLERLANFLLPLWEPLMLKFQKTLRTPIGFQNAVGKSTMLEPVDGNQWPTPGLAKSALGSRLNYRSMTKLVYERMGKPVDDPFFRGRQIFSVVVIFTGWGWNGLELGSGKGGSVLDAEAEAARDTLTTKAELLDQIGVRRSEFIQMAQEAKEQGKDGDEIQALYNNWVTKF